MRILCLVFLATFLASSHAFAQSTKRVERLGMDSTIFTIDAPPDHILKSGKTISVRIHVSFSEHWHLYSSKMKLSGQGVLPLSLKLSKESASLFKLLSVSEAGRVVRSLDTNFNQAVIAHYKPFDIVAKLKAIKPLHAKVPLSFIVNFQSCSESMCMPPRSFEIPMRFLGQKEVFVRQASGKSQLERPN